MSNKLGFVVRLASEKDIGDLTDLHCASFLPEDHVPMMLGKRYVWATYRWQVNSKKAYTLVADLQGKIIGLVAVCDGSFTFPMFVACFPEFMWSLLTDLSLLFNKKLWQRLFRRPDISKTSRNIVNNSGFAQMTIGAVDEAYRGQGVFPALVEATKTYSQLRGSRAIRAGIYKTNTSSRAVFIKGGWIETPELETADSEFYVTYLDSNFPIEIGLIKKGDSHR